MRFLRAAGHDSPAITLKAKALAVGARRSKLTVLIFGLQTELEIEARAHQLQEQLASVNLDSEIRTAGPERVKAVLDGKFSGVDVLVVLGDGASKSEPALMEFVEWLLANSRGSLAENLLYAQLGEGKANTPAPVFTSVILPAMGQQVNERSGRRLPWAASPHTTWELAHAVLDYATGLEAE